MIAAFAAAPREGFLPRSRRGQASYDGPLDIGHGQTNSQPRTVAAMLRLLEVRPGDRVLDVGSGSGWTTALLGHLDRGDRRGDGVEIEPDLVAFGAGNLAAVGPPWTRIVPAEPGVLGLPDHAPYDRILVSADAHRLPQRARGPARPGRPDGAAGQRHDAAGREGRRRAHGDPARKLPVRAA